MIHSKKDYIRYALLIILICMSAFALYKLYKKPSMPNQAQVKILDKRKILLTSGGFNSDAITNKFKDLAGDNYNQPVAIITTASYDKEKDQYAVLAYKQFVDMGFTDIDFVDIEVDPQKDFSKYGVIYVCGGNTFTLLKYAKESNLKSSIEKLLDRGGVYVGVSAGSIIAGPSIASAVVNGDENYIELKDLAGLNLTNTIIYPHYNDNKGDEEIKKFEIENNVILKKLSDVQAILIENGVESMVE